jgi:hypothetical protein
MRKSKRLNWEIMTQLEEAGEEDICSLLNSVMGAQSYYGSGVDLAEYLEALTVLETQGELLVREYAFDDGRRVPGVVLVGNETRPASNFAFDPAEGLWRWTGAVRQNVDPHRFEAEYAPD